MIIRLNKYISACGYYSRRAADQLIEAGQVLVNKKKAQIGQKINDNEDIIVIRGQIVKPSQCFVYYALNKPRGVVSSVSDEKGRRNVADLVPKIPRVYPVGRLDINSEGLIILTNDGDLTNKLTHPSQKHEKEYKVIVSSSKYQVASIEQISKQFTEGLVIGGKLMKVDKVKISPIRNTRYLILLTIHTGYNRQIRKMCAKMNLEIINIKRIRIDKLTLEKLDIKPGDFKVVTKEDII